MKRRRKAPKRAVSRAPAKRRRKAKKAPGLSAEQMARVNGAHKRLRGAATVLLHKTKLTGVKLKGHLAKKYGIGK